MYLLKINKNKQINKQTYIHYTNRTVKKIEDKGIKRIEKETIGIRFSAEKVNTSEYEISS